MRFLLDNVDNDDMERTAPQTESSRERGYDVDEEDLGQSEELDQEAGDIADEGPGHRG
jgi:hypothetical protein